MSKIFVDFDKTITTGEGEPHWVEPLEEEPNKEMIELVNDLYKRGNTIIIYTARDEQYREETQYFIDKWNVRHHALRMQKPGFDLFIDNRAMSVESALEMTAEEIENETQNS